MNLAQLLQFGLNEAGLAVGMVTGIQRGGDPVVHYANESLAKLVRMSAAKLQGAPFGDVLALVQHAGVKSEILSAMATATRLEIDVPLVGSRQQRWVGLALAFPPEDSSGARCMVMIGTDISNARAAAARDERLKALLTSIFVRIDTPVVVTARSGEMAMTNLAFRDLTGFTAKDLNGMRVTDIIASGSSQVISAADEQQLVTGAGYKVEAEIITKQGHPMPVQMTSVLIHDEDQPFKVVTMKPVSVVPIPSLPIDYAPMMARSTGEFRPVSLGALRDLSTATWERLGLRAMLRAEQLIRRRLDPQDVIARLDDHTFGIWFASTSRDRNEEVIDLILRDVRLYLLTNFSIEIAGLIGAKEQIDKDRVLVELISSPPSVGISGPTKHSPCETVGSGR